MNNLLEYILSGNISAESSPNLSTSNDALQLTRDLSSELARLSCLFVLLLAL